MSDVDLGSRKSLFVVVVVVGCFAVLWPKVLHPMMVGSTTNHHRVKSKDLDRGCCDVISDIDINTIKIMNELCNNIIQQSDIKSVRGKDIIQYCRTEILDKCGIDISAVLQEQIRLGYPFKRIVDELRSFNGSSCLKYNFGISPWLLGVPHKVAIHLTPINIKQERSPHMKPEMMHPALRERGSAIPQSYPSATKAPPHVKYVEGRPGPIPGMRPPMGGGHMAKPQKDTNSMGIIMPLYTIGIVIFFSYTLMKVLFRRKPEGPGRPLYPPVDSSPVFRKEVFESQKSKVANGTTSNKLVVNAMTALLDEVDHELEAQRRISEKEQTIMGNGSAKPPHDQPSVKILGMETTASCEGGHKWSRPDSPVIPNLPPPPPEPVEPPQEIYLEGALPAQSQLLVADAITEPELVPNEDPAVVLASKMTLSVISVDVPEGNSSFLQQNGDLNTTENDEESKYTTASCATAAEPDLSEDEHSNDEMMDEIEKLPEYVVNNGIQEIDMDIHIDDEEEIEIDVEEEEIEDEEVDQEEEEADQEEDQEDEEVEEEEIEEWIDEPIPITGEFERDMPNEINDNTKTNENSKITLQTHPSTVEKPSENYSEMLNTENIFTNDNNIISGNVATGNNVDVNENNQKASYLQSNDPTVNAVLEHIATLSNIVDDIVNSGSHSTEEHGPPKLFDI